MEITEGGIEMLKALNSSEDCSIMLRV